MKTYRALIPCLVALSLLVLCAAPVLAGEVTLSNSTSAYASYSIYDGCRVTNLYFFVLRGQDHQPPGVSQERSLGHVYIYQYDDCYYGYRTLLDGSVSTDLPEGALAMDRRLDSASLRWFRVPFYNNPTGETLFLDIDLQWTPTESASPSNYRDRYITPGNRIDSHFIGLNRPAEVTGSVMVNGIELASGYTAYGGLHFGRTHVVRHQQ